MSDVNKMDGRQFAIVRQNLMERAMQVELHNAQKEERVAESSKMVAIWTYLCKIVDDKIQGYADHLQGLGMPIEEIWDRKPKAKGNSNWPKDWSQKKQPDKPTYNREQ